MKTTTVMCIPPTYCYSVAYFSKNKVLYGNANAFSVRLSLELNEIYEELIKGNYKLLEILVETQKVSHIFLDSSRANIERVHYFQKITENGPYIIFST
jgi:hypothetical protein